MTQGVAITPEQIQHIITDMPIEYSKTVMTKTELWRLFGISNSTYYTIKKEHPEFAVAMQAAGEAQWRLRTKHIENVYFRRLADGRANSSDYQYFLNNRNPDFWKSKDYHEHSGPGGMPMTPPVIVFEGIPGNPAPVEKAPEKTA